MPESNESTAKIKRYINYAFGEVIIVVIGILIAFQLDNYAEKRKEKALSREYLYELQKEFSDDKSTLISTIDYYQQMKENTEKLILEVQSGKLNTDDSVAILKTILNAGNDFTFRPKSATYDDIRNTGNLELIVNKELRHQIGDYYDFIEDNNFKEQQLEERVYFQYSLWIEKYVDIRLKFYFKSDSLPYYMSLYQSNLKGLLEDKDFKERLVSAQFANILQLRFFKKTFAMLEKISEETEEELTQMSN